MSKKLFGCCLLLLSTFAYAEPLPDGMMFIGLKTGQWQIYVVEQGKTKALRTATEPRTAAFNRQRSVVAYIGADGALYEQDIHSGKESQILPTPKKRAYTQPAYSRSGQNIYLVDMEDGMSAQTDILAVNLDKEGTRKHVTQQPGAQFEPKSVGSDSLLYSSVSCALGCGRIIQELWLKNLLTDHAKQITVVNAIARQPVASTDGKWAYYSSDVDSQYHIWRVSLDGGVPQQITKGIAADIAPALDSQGVLYFIRYEPSGSKLMRLNQDVGYATLTMPEGVTDIRNLEIAP